MRVVVAVIVDGISSVISICVMISRWVIFNFFFSIIRVVIFKGVNNLSSAVVLALDTIGVRS